MPASKLLIFINAIVSSSSTFMVMFLISFYFDYLVISTNPIKIKNKAVNFKSFFAILNSKPTVRCIQPRNINILDLFYLILQIKLIKLLYRYYKRGLREKTTQDNMSVKRIITINKYYT